MAAHLCTILGFVCAVVAILFLPPVLGLAGLAFGLVGGMLGDRPLGWYAAVAAVIGGVLGMVLTYVLLTVNS